MVPAGYLVNDTSFLFYHDFHDTSTKFVISLSHLNPNNNGNKNVTIRVQMT